LAYKRKEHQRKYVEEMVAFLQFSGLRFGNLVSQVEYLVPLYVIVLPKGLLNFPATVTCFKYSTTIIRRLYISFTR